MKKILILLLSIIIYLPSYGNEIPKLVASTIENVTVFLNGAQVTRKGNTNLTAGTTYLAFSNIAPNINTQSIQVKGEGSFAVLSVLYQLNYLNQQEKTREITGLENRQTQLIERLDVENSLLLVYQQEEQLLLANKSIGGQNQGVKITELKEAADFYRTRLSEIKLKQLEIGKNIKALQTDLNKIVGQLSELHAQKDQPTGEIIVTVSAKNTTSARLELSYLVNNAGWHPTYDIRVKDVNNPISLMYKANVFQTSGEDWKNVKLTLSTGDPQQSGNKPTLQPWHLSLYTPYTRNGYAGAGIPAMEEDISQLQEVVVTGYAGKVAGVNARDQKKKETIPVNATQVQNQTNVEFRIDIPYTIPTDGKSYAVDMKEYNIPAYYEYYCTPKLDNDAFLIAKITGWEEYNLLEGEANLFFEDTFVGKSILNVQNSSDTLNLSLGRDKNIVITRTKIKDYTSKHFIGSNKKDTRSFEIDIRNKKAQAINMVIEDQFPISTNKEIEVTKIESSGAQEEENTGRLTWKFNLAPAQSKKLNIKYEVKYDKKEKVILE